LNECADAVKLGFTVVAAADPVCIPNGRHASSAKALGTRSVPEILCGELVE
jgi:hypothetical protein